MNVGSASIILVLLVFVLSMFGVLSIKASNHELRLAEKLGSSVQEYYNTDALGQKVLAQIDKIVTTEAQKNTGDVFLSNVSEKVKKIEETIGEGKVQSVNIKGEHGRLEQISYQVTMNDKRKLMAQVSFDINNKYSIDQWNVKQESLGEYELEGIEDMETIDLDETNGENIDEIPEEGQLWDGIIDPAMVDE